MLRSRDLELLKEPIHICVLYLHTNFYKWYGNSLFDIIEKYIVIATKPTIIN